MKKLAVWVVLIIVVLWVINQPHEAAALIHNVTHAFATLSTSL